MENPNDENQGLPGKGDNWFTRNRWLVIFGLAVLVYVVYKLCGPETPPGVGSTGLVFNPLDGGVVDDSLGNRDGQINPGEQVKIRVRLTNTGKEPIAGIDLVLMAQDSGVTFVNNDNRVHFNRIAPGESALSEDPFEFKMPSRFIPPCIAFDGKFENRQQAGLIGEAWAIPAPDVELSYSVAANYRLCVGACSLQARSTANEDTLIIDLMLCNGSADGGPALSNPSVEIVAATLIACKRFVAGSPAETITTLQNNLQYGASPVGPGVCAEPTSPTIKTFSFKVPTTWAASVASGEHICVHFTANVYSNPSEGSKTLEAGPIYLGAKALLLQ